MLLLAGNLTHMSKFQVAISRAVQGLHACSLLKSPENQFSLNSITQSNTYLKWLSLIGGSLKFSKFSSACALRRSGPLQPYCICVSFLKFENELL